MFCRPTAKMGLKEGPPFPSANEPSGNKPTPDPSQEEIWRASGAPLLGVVAGGFRGAMRAKSSERSLPGERIANAVRSRPSRSVVWLALASLSVRLAAAEVKSGADAKQFYRVSRWTAENGLPQNTIKALVQTRDGYIWVGTLNGLARF